MRLCQADSTLPSATVSIAAIEGLERYPDEGKRGDAQGDGTEMIGVVLEFDRFVAEIVGDGTADGCQQILPEIVTRLPLRALQEQNNQTGKNQNGQPVIGGFHQCDPFTTRLSIPTGAHITIEFQAVVHNGVGV